MKLVDSKTAKTLKELHYDGYCDNWMSNEKGRLTPVSMIICKGRFKSRTIASLIKLDISDKPHIIPFPRLDNVVYWIRDKFRISIEMAHFATNDSWYADSYLMDYCSNHNTLQKHIEKSHQMIETEKPEHDYDAALETEIKRILKIIQDNPNLFQNASNNH